MDRLKIVSLFSGIGGFEEAFNFLNLNYDLVLACEIDDKARISYKQNFNAHTFIRDVTKLKSTDIVNHDLLLAGFPCQSFSIAGNRYGFNDTRGTLFFDVARILQDKKPKFFLLENVKNLISHDDSNTIKVILNTLYDIGYNVDFTIINTKETGLCQSRERTYIFGILDNIDRTYENDIRNKKVSLLKKNLNTKRALNFFNSLKFNKKEIYLKDILDKEILESTVLKRVGLDEFLDRDIEDLTYLSHNIEKLFDIPREILKDNERQRRVYSVNGIAPTILARADSPKILTKRYGRNIIRKLSIDEVFKAQGFSSSFISNIKRSSVSTNILYKQAGNAVSPLVIASILENILTKYL